MPNDFFKNIIDKVLVLCEWLYICPYSKQITSNKHISYHSDLILRTKQSGLDT